MLIVGHEPNLSEWAKKMTAKDLKIKKGEMLNFKVVDRTPLKAELQWRIIP